MTSKESEPSKTPQSRSVEGQSKKAIVWSMVNSVFGIWALTTIFGGLGVWAYQQWRDDFVQRQRETESADKLDLEISARLGQYAAWFRQHVDSQTKQFKPYVSAAFLESTLQALAGRPSYEISAFKPRIAEVYPEFKERNLIGLYAERLSILGKMGPGRENQRAAPHGLTINDSAAAVRQYENMTNAYKTALKVTVAPDLFFLDDKDPQYENFKARFIEIFLDFRYYDMPYADCFDC